MMKIQWPRNYDGTRTVRKPTDKMCPYAQHLHRGDSIEIELELIICRDQAEKREQSFIDWNK